MKQTGILFILLFSIILVSLPAYAGLRADGLAIGVRASSLGIDLEATKAITNKFTFRFGYNFFTLTQDGENTDAEVTYTLDAKLNSMELLLDYYPWGKSFHLTGGMIMNNNEFEFVATPMNEYIVGTRTFTIEELGSMTGLVTFDGSAPYIGLGWGNPTLKGKKLGTMFDIGVMLQGAPAVDLTATGMIEPTAGAEEETFNSSLEGATVWFVVSWGLTFRLF